MRGPLGVFDRLGHHFGHSIAGAFGTRYYVSNTGSDANNGTSSSTPFQTLAHVSTLTLNPYDAVYLQRGGVWREQLSLTDGGLSGQPITVTAYGVGANPRITGGDALTGWSTHVPWTQVITNGGFETWSGGSGVIADDWTLVTGTMGTEVTQVSNASYGGYAVEFGTYALGLDPTSGSYEVDYSLPSLTVGATYTVTFDVFIPTGATSSLRAYVFSGGTQLGSLTPTSTTAARYQHFSFTFTPTAATGNLLRILNASGGAACMLDNVRCATPDTGGPSNNSYDLAMATDPSLLTLNGSRMAPSPDPDTLASGEWFWNAGVITVYDATGNPDVAGDLIEYPVRDEPFRWNVTGATNTGDITVQDVTVSHGLNRSFRPIAVTGKVNMLSSDFYGSADGGASGNPGTVQVQSCTGGGYVNACTFSDSDNDGAYLWMSPNWEFDTCTFSDINGVQGDGIQFTGSSGSYSSGWHVVSCTFTMTGSASPKGCIITEQGTLANLAEYNVFHGGQYAVAASSTLTTVRGNYCYDQNIADYAAAVTISETGTYDSITITGNVIVGATNAVYSYNATEPTITNLLVQHNTCYNMTQSGVQINAAGATGTIQDNIFDAPSITGAMIDLAGSGFAVDYNLYAAEYTGMFSWSGSSYNTVAAFQTATSQAAHAVTGDPLFTDAAALNFTLQTGSPAIGTGYGGTNIGAL